MMNPKIIPRSDARQASVIRQGLDWYRTYGQRSAAAYMVVRNVPRAVIERVLATAGRREDRPG